MKKIPALVAVIELLLQYHRKALRILLGDYEPTLIELSEIVQAASEVDETPMAATSGLPRSKQLTDIVRGEEIQRIVDEIGGWKQLAEAVKAYKEAYPKAWAIFVDHLLSITSAGSSRIEDQSQLERLAQKYGVCFSTISDKRRVVPIAIARYAELTPNNELRLISEGSF